MRQPLFSIIIPAYDEEQFLPACLDAIKHATERLGEPVEIIVVDNDSHDRTADIAREHGAKVVVESAKCLSRIRNVGAAEATGTYLAFIDADSVMSINMLTTIKKVMESGRYVGGGVANVRSDRLSLGLICSALVIAPLILTAGVSAVMFYTTSKHFKDIGGFDEKLYAVEDLDFGARLKRHGRGLGLRYKNIFSASVTTSARKGDEYGDWVVFRHPMMIWKIWRNDKEAAHEFWYKRRRS